MSIPLTLFDLFGDFTSSWPISVIQRMVGVLGQGSADPELDTWLGALNNGAIVTDTRTGANADRVSVEAKLQFDNALAAFPEGFPFVISSMPDVEFRIQTIKEAGTFIQFFASSSPSGVEVVLEGLPVEIRLPPGLIQPHPAPTEHLPNLPEAPVGEFRAGEHDSLRIVYRRDGPTSVLVHIRLHLTEDNEITIRPSVPITFGKCLFSEMPCLALHDFSLIPSPSLVETNVDWTRHTVKPWLPEHAGPRDGLFAIRSVTIDSEQSPFKGLADKLNESSTREPDAEFVLDDLVVPFYSPYIVPIPRHVTVGIRRRVLEPDDPRQVFQFERAPVQVFFGRDDAWGFIVESLFYKSLPKEDLSEDLGLTFKAAIFRSKEESPQHAFEVGVGENYTLTVGYRRDFGSSTVIDALLQWEIATIVIDVMAFRVGYSISGLVADKPFGDCFEFTVDLFISMPPSGSDKSIIFRMRGLDGEKVAFAIEGLGWRQGGLHLEGLALPDGVQIFIWKFVLILQEIGLQAESGASYLSFSGGLVFPLPKGFQGGIVVKRLRFRVAGNTDTPKVKLDGFFIALRLGTLLISAGGFYSERKIDDDTQISEIGLLGRVDFEFGTVQYMLSLDVLAGDLTSSVESFDYLMFQVAFKGSLVMGWFELRGVRVLFARNMQPKLKPEDRESRELRYYKWFRDNQSAIDLPDDRRLTSWQPKKDAWALGIGASASLAALGKFVELSAFVLVVSGDDEQGWLVVAEVLLAQSPNPIGFAAIQWDGKNDRFSMLLGVNLSPSNFLESIPNWVNRIGRLTGTLFIGNNPTTVAIGKLSDTRTWLSLIFDLDLWVKTFIQFGFCFEYVAGAEGAKGVGLIVRLEGGINARILRLTYNAEFGLLVLAFQTGSADYAAAIWIELALRVVLFRFLRFGISARAEFRTVGARPSRGELRVEIRLETPWYLPDVTWTFEINFGNLQPESLATAVGPLRSASANDEGRQKIHAVHVERIDQSWNGEGVARTFSINQLRGIVLPEADRLARFAGNTAVQPVPTTSRVALEWSVAVNDLLALDNNGAPNLGIQHSGDLTLRYDLVGLSIRRRSRFDLDRSWRMLDQIVELGADFSDPEGVGLSGSFTAPTLTAFWDVGVQIEGRTATKKLLINAKTPFEFQTQNAETDEELVGDNASWPCCGRRPGRLPKIHEVLFREETAGADIVGDRLFSESQSRFEFAQTAYAFPQQFSTTIPVNAIVAIIPLLNGGPVFRAELVEDAAFCLFNLRWTISSRTLLLLAFDDNGQEVGRKEVPPSLEFQELVLPATGPIRRIEARFIARPTDRLAGILAAAAPGHPTLVLDRVAYLGLRDYLDFLIAGEWCSGNPNFGDAYAGRGAISFLPNHDYEIEVTTRMTISHPSKPAESVDTKEYVYFKTKGLPGLNAVDTIGEELAPFVTSAYAGGRGALYREEPIAVSFQEDFHVVVPLVLRPAGAFEERTKLMKLQLVVRPDTAPTLNTPFTETTPDWIVEHRLPIIVEPRGSFLPLLSRGETVGIRRVSDDPFRKRLATITQRPTASCDLADPREVLNTALVAPPQGTTDPSDPTVELWPSLPFTATVKVERAPFIDRSTFVAADLRAFEFALDTGPDPGAWTALDGQIVTPDGPVRRFAIFGEPTWNHCVIECSFAPGASMVGVGVGLPAGNVPNQGLFAVIERTGDSRRLVIFRRTAANQFLEEAQSEIPDTPDSESSETLIVTAFDDRLRATVGDVTIESERNEQRAGRFCLLARGPAQFASLRVSGLPLYQFRFRPSRFRSFTDHILSFDGVFDLIIPNTLGPGTSTQTANDLITAPETAVTPVMQPGTDAAKRQVVFDQWIAALGLPLKDDVTKLEMSRFARAGLTEVLLIESPEPLDFTEEVSFQLEQRVKTPQPPPFEDVVGELDGIFTERRPLPASGPRRRVPEDLVGLFGRAESEVATGVPALGRKFLRNVEREGDTLQIEIDLDALDVPLQPGSRLHFAEAVGSGSERRLRFFVGTVPAGRRKGVVLITTQLTQEIAGTSVESPIVSAELSQLKSGVVVALKPNLNEVLDHVIAHFLFTPVPTQVLQDAKGHRALVIPVSNGGSQPLASGSYRLRFEISRKRWDTTDPGDNLNSYNQTAFIQMGI